jgi:ribosomal protein S14
MINNINKYRFKYLKFLKFFKIKELNYLLIKTIKKENIYFSFFKKNFLMLFFFNLNFFFLKKTKYKMSCIITNNNHSIFSYYSLNRIFIRKFISYSLIYGFYKNTW